MKTLDGSEVSRFLELLHDLEIDMTSLSVVELDRYLNAFRLGATDAESLREAVSKPQFPQEVSIYAHLDYGDLHDVGEQVSLGEEANRCFSSHGPIKLDVIVREDGEAAIVRINGEPLTLAIAL